LKGYCNTGQNMLLIIDFIFIILLANCKF